MFFPPQKNIINETQITEILSDNFSEKQLEIITFIYKKSIEMGLDYDMTLRIARCESQFISNAKNPSSSATGVYQWIDSSWGYYGNLVWGEALLSKDRLKYQDNVELALEIMSLQGTTGWTASAFCWS